MVHQALEPTGQPAATQSRLFITALLGITVALAACWFAYDSHVKTRKAYLIERNLRFLSEQGRALSAAMANYENIFESILQGKPDASLGETRCPQRGEVQTKLKTLCAAPHVKRVVVSESQKRQGELSVQFAKNEARLDYVTNLIGCMKRNEQSVCSIHAEVDITKIMEALPVEELFSDVLLADKEGHVIYQRRSRQDASDLQFADLGILLQKQQGGYDKLLPVMEVATVGGTSFRSFAQAGLISARHQPAGAQHGIDFILSGIVPNERFEAEASAIPSDLLLIAMGMILAAFLTLPYLKLKALQPNEAISLTDVLILMFSSLMWVGFLTFSVLLLVADQQSGALFDQMLKSSATAISDNFAEDLKDARYQLSLVDSLCESYRDCRDIVGKPSTDTQFWQFGITVKNGHHILELQKAAGEPWKAALSSYDVNKVFWVGADGTKLLDWWRRRAWQKMSLGGRDYVRRILDRTGLSVPGSSRSETPDDQYWIEPTYSWINGKNTVAVSQPSHIRTEQKESVVAALELMMPSVMDPVVQPGFGFAVMNDLGKVLFHSDSKRNLREDFFAETDHNQELRTHVLSRTSHFSSGQYWGKDRRFFTMPLNGTDGWSLVVFRDSSVLDDAELRALFAGLLLFVVYSALILGVGVFGFILYPDLKVGQGHWLQPHPQHTTAYRRITLLNVALLVVFGFVQGHPYLELNYPNWHQMLLLSPFVLPLIMALTIYAVTAFSKERPASRDLGRYRRDHTMMAVSCLLIFAMVPAYGFFKFAWNGEMNLYALFTQFDFAKDQHEREQAVRQFYQGVTFRPEAAGEQFLRDRLTQYDRDVYRDFLLYPRLDAEPGLSEKILAWLRIPLNDHFSSGSGGLLDVDGYNRTWVPVKQAGVPAVSSSWLDHVLSSVGITRPTLDQSVKHPSGIPHWLYWLLSLGAVCLLHLRHAATQAMVQRQRFVTIGLLVLMLISVVGFAIWPTPAIFLTIAAVGLFMKVLYALPRITDEGLRALNSGFRPTVGGIEQPEGEQRPEDDLSQRHPVSFLSHILWPVKIGLVALVAFIIFTQEEYRPIALAALATILPEISKLLPELHKILGGFKPAKANINLG